MLPNTSPICDHSSISSVACGRGPARQHKGLASIRHAAGRRKRVEPPLAQQMGGERARTEDVRKSAMAHIETACEGPEGRHDQPCAVAGEAAPGTGAHTTSHTG